MAIQKETIVGNKATSIDYWKYSGWDRMAKNILLPTAPVNANGVRIPQNGIVVLMDGYSTADIRNAARTNGRIADHTYEFVITNWLDGTVMRNDYDTYRSALNTSEEASTAYGILKQNPVSSDFFAGAANV